MIDRLSLRIWVRHNSITRSMEQCVLMSGGGLGWQDRAASNSTPSRLATRTNELPLFCHGRP